MDILHFVKKKKKEYVLIPWKILYIYSETKRSNENKKESKTESNIICDVIQHEKDRCRL